MLECLLLVTFAGLLLASQRKMGPANPFRIYFVVWFLVFIIYYILRDSFIPITTEFLGLMLLVKLFAFVLLALIFVTKKSYSLQRFPVAPIVPVNDNLVIVLQVLVILALPFAYQKSIYLSGGENIFSVFGYIKLRSAMTQDGESYGMFSYVFTLSFVLSSMQVMSYVNKKTGMLSLVVSVLVSVFYAYLSTGRTFVLLFAILSFVPLILVGVVRARGMLIFLSLLVVFFVVVTTMTAKGISLEAGVSENLIGVLNNLRGYTVAPMLALHQLMESAVTFDWGLNSFRIVILLFNGLGLIETSPLIREFEFVPDPTNVYTVYEVYFRDFSYLGLVVPLFFLVAHWWLYVKARQFGGLWIYYYSASAYPLLMQFFQDQYFSLASMWVQIAFWYWFLISFSAGNKKRVVND